jgi:hypothetical protein
VEDGEVFGPNISIKLKIKQKAVDDETTLYKIRYIGASEFQFNKELVIRVKEFKTQAMSNTQKKLVSTKLTINISLLLIPRS